MIKVTASKTTIEPGEIVRLTGYADPLEDIVLDIYVNNVRVAIQYIYLETLGINYIEVKPSIWGDVVTFMPYGWRSGEKGEPVTVTTVTPPPAVYTLSLSASKTSIQAGEYVTFTVKVSPAVAYGVKLNAYVDGVWKGSWDIFTDSTGVGSVLLQPSAVGNVVDWQAVDAYGNKSNTVTVTTVTPPPAVYTLSLSANKTSNIESGELVVFTVKVSPAVAYTVKLNAYVKGVWKGYWYVYTDSSGVGTITLVPSVVGDVVDWQAEDEYGNKSNTVTTSLKAIVPTMGTIIVIAYVDNKEVPATVGVRRVS
jgi:hypothetical protein